MEKELAGADQSKILAGRKAVDAYRIAHIKLHEREWHRGIPEEHTPLLNIMLNALNELGFNTVQEFFNASNRLNLIETGIFDREPRKSRLDLSMIGNSKELNEVVIREREKSGEPEFILTIDDEFTMSTYLEEHLSMERDTQKCPEDARCFVAGLGLGLILLYLAESNKTREVIVCELDERIISLLGEPIKSWMANHYPDFTFHIIHGDAFDIVLQMEKFDWILFDTNLQELEVEFNKTAQLALTARGVYTAWRPYEVIAWN